jgi:hypothetical protein
MYNLIRFSLVALVFAMAAACVDSDDQIDDIDLERSPADDQPADDQPADDDSGNNQRADDPSVGAPGAVVDEVPRDTAGEGEAEEASVRLELWAGKQPNHPEAWLAHAVANESECGHTSCPFIVEQVVSEPESIPPFERVDASGEGPSEGEPAEETPCMLDGGLVIADTQTFEASAEAGAAQARFVTDITSGAESVDISVAGEAKAGVPSAGGVRSDAGATLYADETALVLDITNPTGEPVDLEVSWELSGEPERGEASWQGSLWYTDNPSRLAECYVAPDYQFERVFDVFQDVGGSVRGRASGSAILPIDGEEHSQVGLRLNIGAHAVGREGSRPELAQDSASRVEGTLRFRVATPDDRR